MTAEEVDTAVLAREKARNRLRKEIAFEKSFIGDERCSPEDQAKHKYCAGILTMVLNDL